MPLLPVAMFGLEVPAGDILVPAQLEFPATIRITMAAIDPSQEVEAGAVSRATLKILRQENTSEDDESDDEDDEEKEAYLKALLAGDEEDSEEEEEEKNGGPSDPAKSKKAKKQAALEELLASIGKDDSDEEMEDATKALKKADKKGKAKATEEDEDSDEDSEGGDQVDMEEFVLCTLNPEQHYQQPLDITIGENETVCFKVTGTHTIYLTGNYLIPDDDGHNHHHEVYDSDSEDDEDYDLSPDEDELELEIDSDESDELDGVEDPRITEVESEDEEAPKLVKAEKKSKKKRSADELEEGASLDEIMAKSLKAEAAEEPKLSKKQLKKLKKNNGEAVAVGADAEAAKKAAPAKAEKADKKVQFAKNLEQGPTPSTTPVKDSSKGALGVKTVDGVKIDDKKLGTGPPAKKGNRVGMRYIGKLLDGKVFDSNKKGKPFAFKLGAKEVIAGWDIGIAGMCVGGERRLTIPAHHAYGKSGVPGIPPHSTLVFDVKLLEIK